MDAKGVTKKRGRRGGSLGHKAIGCRTRADKRRFKACLINAFMLRESRNQAHRRYGPGLTGPERIDVAPT